MNRIGKIILITAMLVFGFACGAFLSVRAFKEKGLIRKDISSSALEDVNVSQDNTGSKNTNSKKKEYKVLDSYSVFVDKMYAILPKELQFEENKTSDEYITFAAVSALSRDEKEESVETEEGFKAYSAEKVLDKAKKIYGDNAKILKQNTSCYIYKEDIDAIAPLPYSSGSASDYQVVKEVREYSDRYELDVFLVTINYSEKEILYITSKETLKLIREKCEDEKQIKDSYVKYKMEGAKVNIEDISKEIPTDLPIATYTVEKIDERGLKYYLKDYKIN